MSKLRAQIATTGEGGQWQVYIYPEGAKTSYSASDYDVTIFRGAATEINSLGTTDPFGPSVATLRFPKVTMFDRRGYGDLWWCVPEANVDISWVDETGVIYTWEGWVSTFEFGEESASSYMTIQCLGALKQLDLYLAKPEYLYAPITFERGILRQFENRPDLRLARPRIKWPVWWDKSYALDQSLLGSPWLVPQEVEVGANWTGMVTRYTGQFEQALSGYIQQLLSTMHTERGQFTLDLERGRSPVIKHRDLLPAADDNTLVVDLLWPGVEMSLIEDHTQKLNTVFVQGKTLSGVTYSGMQVTNDGKRTFYEPYAARRNVHPQADNAWLDVTQMRREVQLPAADGMASDDARIMARAHLQKFSDPGLTGVMTLSVDPLRTGLTFPRQAITAGMAIQVKSLFGIPDGRLFHIAEATITGDSTLTLTLDSKFRDQLTVQEVRSRGRDALAPVRMLTTGNWQPTVQDQLFPWSYDLGSGYVPFGSAELFRGIGTNEGFPWENWTKAHPPKDPQWKDKYIRIGPRSANMDNNWSTPAGQVELQWPILLSAAGSSRMIQIAAYDADGNLFPVSFHFSIYNSNSVDATTGPMIPDEWVVPLGYSGTYDQRGLHHPFFPGAWETLDARGVSQNPLTPQAEAASDIVIGWGNYYERCGYWPGQSSDPNDPKTGLFVDEVSFSWDTTQLISAVNPQEEPEINTADITRAMLTCLLFCDDQGAEDVYFLGRIYRAEPGTA